MNLAHPTLFASLALRSLRDGLHVPHVDRVGFNKNTSVTQNDKDTAIELANEELASAQMSGDAAAIAQANQDLADAWALQVTTTADQRAHPRTLSAGMQGDDVGIWQNLLGVPMTNTFDSATVAATKAFQKSKGLVADGIVGPKTRAAMFGMTPKEAGLEDPPKQAAPPPQPAPPPQISPTPPPAPKKKGLPWKTMAIAGAAVAGAFWGVPKLEKAMK